MKTLIRWSVPRLFVLTLLLAPWEVNRGTIFLSPIFLPPHLTVAGLGMYATILPIEQFVESERLSISTLASWWLALAGLGLISGWRPVGTPGLRDAPRATASGESRALPPEPRQ